MKTKSISLLGAALLAVMAFSFSACGGLDAEPVQESRAGEIDDIITANDSSELIYATWKVVKVNGEDYKGDVHYVTLKLGGEFRDMIFRPTSVDYVNAGAFVIENDKISVTNADQEGNPTGTRAEYLIKSVSEDSCTLELEEDVFLLQKEQYLSPGGYIDFLKDWTFDLNGNTYDYEYSSHGGIIHPITSAKLEDGELYFDVEGSWNAHEVIDEEYYTFFIAKVKCKVNNFDYNTVRYGTPLTLNSSSVIFSNAKQLWNGDCMSTVESVDYDYALDADCEPNIIYYSHCRGIGTFYEDSEYLVLYVDGLKYKPVGESLREGYETLSISGFITIPVFRRSPSGIVPVYAD